MSTAQLTVRAAAVAVSAMALSIGLSTAPVHAAPYLNVTANLTYRPVVTPTHDVYLFDVQGVVTMSKAAAQDSINHGHSVQLRYWGDDPSDDDLIYGPIPAPNMSAQADGLHYQYNVNLTGSQLNEDDTFLIDAPIDDGQDEIYIGARFVDPYGKTLSRVESNRIHANF